VGDPRPGPDPAHSAARRGRALLAAAAEVEAGRNRFVDQVRRAHRCGISEAVAQVDSSVDAIVRWAGWADKLDLLLPSALGRRPPPVAILAPEEFLGAARAVCSALAAGARCVVAHESPAVGSLVDVVAAEFPASAVSLVARDPDTVRKLATTVPLLDARAAQRDYDADLRLACAEAGTRVLPPLPAEDLRALTDLDLVGELFAGATRTV
jgi:acyl-CoA reductase-like NAD-dependent aldehyde dehydrogenase